MIKNSEVWFTPSMPPVNNRVVLIKAKEYPDIFTGYYEDGKWYSCNDFNETDNSIEFDVVAWRDIPIFDETKKVLNFRNADEARHLSRQAIQMEEDNTYDMHFFEVRTLLIKATSVPHVWSVNIGERPMYIIEKLRSSGFIVEENEDGTYEVSWDKTPEEFYS